MDGHFASKVNDKLACVYFTLTFHMFSGSFLPKRCQIETLTTINELHY